MGATASYASNELCELGPRLLNLSEPQIRFDLVRIYKKGQMEYKTW